MLGESIISDLGNPAATSVRAILTALAEAGHQVTFLEQRNNASYLSMLKRRGSRALRGFSERYPSIQFRTYDLPRGWERTVWFGREIGTADAILALPGTPAELLPEIAAMPSMHVVRFIDESLAIAHDGFQLSRAGATSADSGVPFGPAVLARSSAGQRSPILLIVAYDNFDAAHAVAETLSRLEPVLISSGTADLSDWQYLPEIELPGLYATHREAIVVGAGESPWARAREFLPLAYGCASIQSRGVSQSFNSGSAIERGLLPASFDATMQATRIIGITRAALLRF